MKMELTVSNPFPIFSNNIPVTVLKTWPAKATLFDGDQMAGPFPSLFSEDTAASLASIGADLKKSHWDLMRISRLIFMPETITIQEATATIKKPR